VTKRFCANKKKSQLTFVDRRVFSFSFSINKRQIVIKIAKRKFLYRNMSNHLLMFEMSKIKKITFFLIFMENYLTEFDEENSLDRSKKNINLN